MSCLGLKNQQLLPRKTWNSLTSTLRTKLRKLRRSRPVKSATAAISVVHIRRTRSPHSRHIVYTGRRSQHHGSTAVYVDELFNRPSVAHVEQLAPTTEVKQKQVFEKSPMKEEIAVGCSSSSSRSVGQLGGVDLRAELFIAKFWEEMKLQRQRSFGEFHEMLARGT